MALNSPDNETNFCADLLSFESEHLINSDNGLVVRGGCEL